MISQHAMFEPIPRPRVMELLARVTRRPIGLVVAPAGYGKSVAASQYLLQKDVASVWFTVRDEHAKLLSFAWGLARALSQTAPGLERGLLAAYQAAAAETQTPVALAAWFAAGLDDCSISVVVDDLHLVLGEPSVRDFIVAVVERSPVGLRWILLSRSAFDLPLATWLAYGRADDPVGESDLSIRSDEAAAIAQACDLPLSLGQLEDLLTFTSGWPAAFIFALRAAARGTEPGRIVLETREKLYAYLADQAFGALSPVEQQFLLGTALLPVVDLELLAAAGWEEPHATYARLRRNAAFIVPRSASTFCYHDLFREFLEHRLRLQGAATYRCAQLASAALLEADRADLALRLRVAAGDRAGVVRLLRDHSSRPTLGGMVDAIEEAILSLPQAELRSDSVLLGLLARTRELRIAWDESDSLYRAAIDLAGTVDQRAELTMSLAATLQRRRRYEAAFSALSELDADEIHDPASRARLLSRLAVLLGMRRELSEAQRLATESLAATVLAAPEVRADIVFAAGLVSHFANRPAEARNRTSEAIKAAEQSGNSHLVARCADFLCWDAINEGDWNGAARFLAQALIHARREGDLDAVNHVLQTSLLLAPMRGDAARIAEDEAAFERRPQAHPDSEVERAFARAMRFAWSGDFEAARRETESGLRTPEGKERALEQALLLPYCAVYHAAAGDRDAALDANDRATSVLAELGTSATPDFYATFMNIGRVLLAVAHALSLRSRATTKILSDLEKSDPKPIPAVTCLAQAARTINRIAQGVVERDALEGDLVKVREQGLGGYADLFAALPVGVTGCAAAFGTLTKTEMQMLRLIARGGTMKAIALGLNRSPDTVETHIRAILRKLGCKSRNEAVALARDHGIV